MDDVRSAQPYQRSASSFPSSFDPSIIRNIFNLFLRGYRLRHACDRSKQLRSYSAIIILFVRSVFLISFGLKWVKEQKRDRFLRYSYFDSTRIIFRLIHSLDHLDFRMQHTSPTKPVYPPPAVPAPTVVAHKNSSTLTSSSRPVLLRAPSTHVAAGKATYQMRVGVRISGYTWSRTRTWHHTMSGNCLSSV